jgi:FAD synthetase
VEQTNGRPLGIVMGTRRGDPDGGGLQAFTPSSAWMPPFMRVNPILAWTYGEVWAFLKGHGVPYCSLYDEGYTSLGHVDDTAKNPALKRYTRGVCVCVDAIFLEVLLRRALLSGSVPAVAGTFQPMHWRTGTWSGRGGRTSAAPVRRPHRLLTRARLYPILDEPLKLSPAQCPGSSC